MLIRAVIVRWIYGIIVQKVDVAQFGGMS